MIRRFRDAWRADKLISDIFGEHGVVDVLFRVYVSLRAAFNPRYFS